MAKFSKHYYHHNCFGFFFCAPSVRADNIFHSNDANTMAVCENRIKNCVIFFQSVCDEGGRTDRPNNEEPKKIL